MPSSRKINSGSGSDAAPSWKNTGALLGKAACMDGADEQKISRAALLCIVKA